jgi:hypothetical protein
LSSAILYLAIVAIWAVVLVPRWLRPRQAQPRPVPVPAEPADAEWHEPAAPGQDAGARADAIGGPVAGGPVAGGSVADGSVTGGPVAGDSVAGGPVAGDSVAGGPVAGGSVAGGPVTGGPVASADADDGDAGDEEAAAPSPATRRAEVLKARRRLLTTLVTLTVIAVALVVTRIDAYWIVIPPAVLLGGYLTLLRKFVRLDAERARHAARIRHAAARARSEAVSRDPVPAAPAAAGPDRGSAPDVPVASAEPHAPDGAEVIDISGRIGDQVYDQYSDAANRAVGD